MDDITTPREQLLKKVRSALLNKFESPIQKAETDKDLKGLHQSNPEEWVKAFTQSGGGFVYCHHRFDFLEKLLTYLDKRNSKEICVSAKNWFKELEELGLVVKQPLQYEQQIPIALIEAEGLNLANASIISATMRNHGATISAAQSLLVLVKLSNVYTDIKQVYLNLKQHFGDRMPAFLSSIKGPNKWLDESARPIKTNVIKNEVIVFVIADD